MNAPQNVANVISYNTIPFDFPCREKASPGMFSTYRKVFKGVKWDVFFTPGDASRSAEFANQKNVDLWQVPCVYEFAVSLSPTSKRYKVYVGKAVNAYNRMHDYVAKHFAHGDHTGTLMREAVESGLYIMRRIRYIIPRPVLTPVEIANAELMAVQTETRLLGRYNFAWNAASNGDNSYYGRFDRKIFVRRAVRKSFLCMFNRVAFIESETVKDIRRQLRN